MYQTAKTFGQRPSQIAQIDGDPWLAYQFDSAVALVGGAIENAAQETVNVGTEKEPKWKPRYTMQQLLDPEFRLPTNGNGRNNAPIENDVKGIQGIMFDEV